MIFRGVHLLFRSRSKPYTLLVDQSNSNYRNYFKWLFFSTWQFSTRFFRRQMKARGTGGGGEDTPVTPACPERRVNVTLLRVNKTLPRIELGSKSYA